MNITREQFFNFVKSKYEDEEYIASETQHYLDYYDKYMTSGKKGNWNWSAFFAGVFWMFHRKMYTILLLLVLFNLTTTFLSNNFLLVPIISNILERYGATLNVAFSLTGISLFYIIVVMVLQGRYSDYLYLWHANRRVAQGKEQKCATSNSFLTIVFVVLMICVNYYNNSFAKKTGEDIGEKYFAEQQAKRDQWKKEMRDLYADYYSNSEKRKSAQAVDANPPKAAGGNSSKKVDDFLDVEIIFEKKNRSITESSNDSQKLILYFTKIAIHNENVMEKKAKVILENMFTPEKLTNLKGLQKLKMQTEQISVLWEKHLKKINENIEAYITNALNIYPQLTKEQIRLEVEKNIKIKKDYYHEQVNLYNKIVNLMQKKVSEKSVKLIDGFINFDYEEDLKVFNAYVSQVEESEKKFAEFLNAGQKKLQKKYK